MQRKLLFTPLLHIPTKVMKKNIREFSGILNLYFWRCIAHFQIKIEYKRTFQMIVQYGCCGGKVLNMHLLLCSGV